MNTSVVTTTEELDCFLTDAVLGLGDPSEALCLLFVKWASNETGIWGEWDHAADKVVMQIATDEGVRVLPMRVSADDCVIEDGVLRAFHVRKVSRGTWALAPSLNIPGELHAFVVLTDVPDPAPWERLVILVSSF